MNVCLYVCHLCYIVRFNVLKNCVFYTWLLATIGTSLMPVKSLGLFKTLFSFPVFQSLWPFGHIWFSVLFYSIFLPAT